MITASEPKDLSARKDAAKALADAIGRKNIADAAGVGLTAVSNAVVRGSFPPSWFIAVSTLAIPLGVHCPPEIFSMVMPTNTPNVDARQRKQGVK